MRIIWCMATLLALGQSWAMDVESVKVMTEDGRAVEGLAQYPAVSGKVPAVVLAPGQGYHMRLLILERMAAVAAENGIAAVRFNWNYFSQGGQPSVDLSRETEDMRAVIDYARRDPRIDASRIVVAGKSLGSAVNYRVFSADATLHSLFLLTPLCRSPEEMSAVYPDLATQARPALILVGNHDSICPLGNLYRHLSGANQVVTVVVPGDHGLALGPDDEPGLAAKNRANVEAAVALSVHWLRRLVLP